MSTARTRAAFALSAAGTAIFTAVPALAMSDAEARGWLASTTQVRVVAHGPGSPDGPYAYVRDSEVEGFVEAQSAVHGPAANGQDVVAIPLNSGGSMGVRAALLFTSYGGRRRFVGYIPSLEGHLRVQLSGGRIVTTTPSYAAGEPNCCPSRLRIETFSLSGIRLTKLSERLIPTPRSPQ